MEPKFDLGYKFVYIGKTNIKKLPKFEMFTSPIGEKYIIPVVYTVIEIIKSRNGWYHYKLSNSSPFKRTNSYSEEYLINSFFVLDEIATLWNNFKKKKFDLK